MDKTIDVIIPAYNAGNTIDKTLMSIAIQSIVDKVCVIIVDDCSNKENQDLYHKYMEMFKPYMRIDYVRLKKNVGPGGARQAGLEFGNSDFVTFIDADDVFATSTALFVLDNEINKGDEICYCNSIFQEEVKDSNGNFYAYYDHTNDMTWMFGKIYRRSFLNKYSIRFNNSRANEDCGFNTICSLCNFEGHNSYVDRLTYCWNYNDSSITKNNDYNFNGLRGYIYNNIWSIHEFENRLLNRDNQFSDEVAQELNIEDSKTRLVSHVVNTMNLLYFYYESLVREGRSTEQIDTYKNWVLNFYRDVYIRYRNVISRSLFVNSYKRVRSNNERLIENHVESISVLEFIAKIDELLLSAESIKTITDEKGNFIGYIKDDVYKQIVDNDLNEEDKANIIKTNLIKMAELDKYINDIDNTDYPDFFKF